MLFGMTIEPYMLIVGGGTIFALVVFQILQGARKIKFKGKLHLTVHKWVAIGILVVSVFHGLLALAYFGIV
ncbi:MAG: hypothetical protein RBS17_05295 [Coriobacteriia bacterium]|nr:hypothetical protein [Coriobacteriia bacterium]